MFASAAQFLQSAESPPQGMVLPTIKMSLSILIHVIKRPVSLVILDSVSLAVNTPSHTYTLCQKHNKCFLCPEHPVRLLIGGFQGSDGLG